jgi:hypothetical protein
LECGEHRRFGFLSLAASQGEKKSKATMLAALQIACTEMKS